MIGARVQFLVLGSAGGLAFWALSDLLSDWHDTRALLALALLAVVFFGTALATLGELGARRALLGGAALGGLVAALGVLKSFGFSTSSQMMEAGHVLVALIALGSLPVPFWVAHNLRASTGWTDYRVLFLESWNIVVRYAAAWAFVGAVWVVLLLSAALLRLVGVELLADLLAEELVIWLICGAALGLGLSVVTEMSDMVSPYLLLRLLRLLLPVVLGVVVVFVAVLPLRGLTHLFGHLSAAGTLGGTAVVVISLIAIAVDQDDVEAPHAPALIWSARGLALLLPVLSGLAAWAVALRVDQYGWTPARVMAAAGVAVLLGYAVAYALAVLTGRYWMGWVRRANTAMALAMIALAVVWLTPLISPERIAVNSQLGRFAEGRLAPEALPLWELANDWGKPGQAALADLRVQAAENAALAEALVRLDQAGSRWDLERDLPPGQPERVAALRQLLVVQPAGAEMPEDLLDVIARSGFDPAFCDDRTPAGNPGCLLVLADLMTDVPGDEALLLAGQGRSFGLPVRAFWNGPRGWQTGTPVTLGRDDPADAMALIDTLSGAPALSLEPAGLMALKLGMGRLTMTP
ncbi:MAG: DUF4153 domain-containing protein [Paracoccaceae bacterium]|nr:DUF4153 domain-containing protein [Paracoccaceae bacterium]